MEPLAGWHVVGTAAVAVVTGYILTACARRLAPRLGLVDCPDGHRKLHGRAVPLMGGVAVLATFVITFTAASAFGPSLPFLSVGSLWEQTPLFASALLYCLLGLWDDRFGMRPRSKLLGQIVASLPFALFGPPVEAVDVFGWQWSLGAIGAVFVVMWLVGCSNVVNLIDGMDGLASLVGVIASLSLAAFSFVGGRLEVAMLALILSGSLLGFLAHNWPPARIFLGDAGSLTIGFLIGAISIEGSFKRAAGFTMIVPLVLISVPIFDTCMAIVRRKLSGRGLGEADRGHIHHRLQDRGMDRRQALLAIAGLSAAMSLAAIASVHFDNDWIAVGACVLVCLGLIAGGVFGNYETRLFVGHLFEMTHLVVDSARQLPTRLLAARLKYVDPLHHPDLWQEVCRRVDQMGAMRLEFAYCRDADREMLARKTWHRECHEPSSGQLVKWEFQYAAPRDDGMLVTMEVHGEYSVLLPNQRLDELFRLLHSFCQHWKFERDMPTSVLEFDSSKTVRESSQDVADFHRQDRTAA